MAGNGTGASAVGQASAAIVKPLTVRAIDPLVFGMIVASPMDAGTVTIDPASGAASYAGSVRGVCESAACAPHAAVFGVTGEPGRRYRVTAPPLATAFLVGGSGAALSVSDLTLNMASQPGSESTGLLDSAGRDAFNLGGTLQVEAGSRPGIYRADVEVVVSYD